MRTQCRNHLVCALERTQQTSLLRLTPIRGSRAHKCYATATKTIRTKGPKAQSRVLALTSEARHNAIGVQQVSSHVHSQLFPNPSATSSSEPDPELVALSKDHLARHDLLGKTSDNTDPIAFDLPDLQGASLDEHFYRLGMDSAEPYLTTARKYARASPPSKPRKWVQRSGWTKYNADGTSQPVDAPDEDALTFDTEVMWRETSFPAMACAVSATHWYAWLSPWLLGGSEEQDCHLIPMGDPSKSRLIIGHNIGYDRARILEEYSLQQSRNFFMDTMSLHVAVNGMCSRQRPTWVKHRNAREFQDNIAAQEDNADISHLLNSSDMDMEEELWVGRSSGNSLRDVAKFHCGIAIDKSRREWFGELDRAGVVDKLDELLDYCAADVEITHKVYKKVFPNFLETCPHPVSFAALRHLSSEILPVNKTWEAYLANAEATYHRLTSDIEERLADLAEKAVAQREDADLWEKDPWLRQLDWSGQEVRMVKGKKKGDPPRLAARQKKPGMPKWYKDLFPTADSSLTLTVRTRTAPLLFRMAWDGHPLVWSDKYGWTFKVPHAKASDYQDKAMTQCDMYEEENLSLKDDHAHTYFKLPHKDGPQARCTNPLAKGYLQFFESGLLSSEYEYAKEALNMNASCSYWISSRDRIKSQMVVYEKDKPSPKVTKKTGDLGYIIPQVIPMGTITRRAVESTWLTASNAKANRVGSELKSMIRAPHGYCFVGADVDSQELWIASLVGDASFKLHGGNAIGFMTLEGNKASGTDLHSRTAAILGISRNDAKVFNYGRIYGAGLTFAQSLLRQFNPQLKEEDAARIASDLYLNTKGQKRRSKLVRDRSFWVGGTESLVFNRLEDFAAQDKPRTPVLGAGITEALMQRFVSKGGFMTSRINWAIQSSGVDYLHLLIVSMEYLCRRYNIAARLALTVHDEIRYLVKEKDKYRAAMALQVANVWTRALFSQQMGIDDLPQSCAYFSAIDVDHVLRKEVDMDCVTPSHPNKIAPGESVDILQLLAKGNEAFLDPNIKPRDPPAPQRFDFTPQIPVMESMNTGNSLPYLRAQIASDKGEFDKIVKSLKPSPAPKSSTPLKDKPERPKRGPRKQSEKQPPRPSTLSPTLPQRMQPTSMQSRRYPSVPMPIDWEEDNKFIQYYDEKRNLGNTAVDVGLMRRLGARQVFAKHH